MEYQKMLDLSKEALRDPQPGDYWQEMYSWHMYVVDVEETDKGKIITTMSASSPCELPKDGKIEKRTYDEFVKWLSYNSTEGTWALCCKRNLDMKDYKNSEPKEVEFTFPHPTGGYGCKSSGNMQGTYIAKSDYEKLLKKIEDLEKELAIVKKDNDQFLKKMKTELRVGYCEKHTRYYFVLSSLSSDCPDCKREARLLRHLH